MNTLGRTAPSAMTTIRWAMNSVASTNGGAFTTLPEQDYKDAIDFCMSTGSWLVGAPSRSTQQLNTEAGILGSCQFAQSIDLETTSGMEISGLNAEEQSDISLLLRYSAAQSTGFIYDVFTYVDQMLVLHENNVMELIQ